MDLLFAGSDVPENLDSFGTVIEKNPPRVKLKVPRNRIPEILSSLLSRYNIDDVSVQERPLEDVIAEVFTHQKEQTETTQQHAVTAVSEE